MTTNPKFIYALAERLVSAASSETGFVYYADLSKQFALSPRVFAEPLGKISLMCNELGYPLLSAIVVTQDTGMPGEGFYQFAADLLGEGTLPPSDWEAFWEKVIQDVWNCDDWSQCLEKLSHKLGLTQLHTPPLKNSLDVHTTKNRVSLESVEADIYAELIEEGLGFDEGKQNNYFVKQYERDPKNRKCAIDMHGLECAVCGFNFEDTYGKLGKGFIEIHHKIPLSAFGGVKHKVNPETDLVPVCANCHRMMHRRHDNVLSVEELKIVISERKTHPTAR